jgi:hypothetical protein
LGDRLRGAGGAAETPRRRGGGRRDPEAVLDRTLRPADCKPLA